MLTPVTYDFDREAERAARASKWIDRLTIFQLIMWAIPATLLGLGILGCFVLIIWDVLNG